MNNKSEKKFTEILHKINQQTELDETFVHYDAKETLKTELYPHQKTLVQAIMELEKKRYIKIDKANKSLDDITSKNIILETDGCVLSEPFGSGKTLIILGLIASQSIPRVVPLNVSIKSNEKDDVLIDKKLKFKKEIKRKHNRIINSNIILVGRSVLKQWECAIKDFTNIKYFVISDVKSLKEFYTLIKNNVVHYYKIILVKNGQVTGKFLLDDEKKETHVSIRSLIDVIAKISKNITWL